MDKKIILVSGGSEGLGKAIASALSKDHRVIILSRNLDKLKKVSEEIGVDYVQADIKDFVSVVHAVDSIMSKYGSIDVLVNNAGVWIEGQLDENEPEKISEIFQVNTLGTIFLTKAVLPSMKSSGFGRIINIVSQDGLSSKKNRSIYSASKWAVTGFTKCLQEDMAHTGIGVTAINPGLIKTSLFEKQGVDRNLSNALDPAEVADIVKYVINLSQGTFLPEISIKNINNSNNMDDQSNPTIGLDINPDMITPQTSIPQVPNTNDTLPQKGVLDITPGAGDESHPSTTEDITPAGNPPAEIMPNAPTPTPTSVPTPQSPIPTPLTATEPPVPTPAPDPIQTPVQQPAIEPNPTSHLADMVPPTATPEPSMETPVSPAPTQPLVTETPQSTAAPQTEVELPPATPNPLAEDPDNVQLNK